MDLIERAAQRLAKAPVEGAEQKRDQPRQSIDGLGVRAEVREPARPSEQYIELNFQRLREMGYALPADESALAEEVRLIKRALLQSAFPKAGDGPDHPNLIMVTSCAPNEGKTFTAINLALSMAFEHDTPVLLLDADFIKSSIPNVLGFKAKRGLVDAVADPSLDLQDVLIRTNIKNLTLLPAGKPSALSSELLASSKMTGFIEKIAKRFADGVIVMDSPPVLARSDASVLARHAGQIVFVVEAQRTSKAAIEDALQLLDRERVRFLMNKAAPAPERGGFGRYYSYYKKDM